MNLQHTANHLAAQGRNGDSMLMHVSPNEVAGLQALAQQHGRSMTTNPHTGMPEAFEFKELIPAAAGFALDMFLPGAGEAAAGLFGLTGAGAGAIGTAGIVGGLAGLSSGSLEKGIMAGLGAYGGASLAGGLGAAGSNANTLAANNAAQAAGLDDAARVAAIQAAAKPDIRAGLSAAAANPIDFLKNNKFGVAAAALPSLMSMGSQSGAPIANRNPGYIRKYAKNPVTGALEQVSATPVDEFGDRSAVSFGGVGQPVRYAAEGGVMGQPVRYGNGGHLVYNPTTKKYDEVDASGKPVGPVTFGGVSNSTSTGNANDTRTDSQKAYDYLMGVPGARNPMLFYHQQDGGGATGALVPADLNTRTGGHYVINAAGTGYDWVPDVAATTNVADVVEGPGGGQDRITDTTGDTGGGLGVGAGQGVSSTTQNTGLGLMALADKYSVLAPLGFIGKSIVDSQINNLTKAQETLEAIDTQNKTAATEGSSRTFDPYDGTKGVMSISDKDGNIRSFDPYAGDSAKDASRTVGPAISDLPSSSVNPNGISEAEAAFNGRPAGGDVPQGDPNAPNPFDGTAPGWGGSNNGSNDSGNYGGNGSGYMANGGMIGHYAQGGLGSLGGYSDGGRLLRGPGDGVSDSIPATIGQGRQPARLADGEFVVPARIVSELGNGSTEAGAKQLYAMLARIQAGRKKSIGKNNVAKNSNAARYLPA